MQNQQRLNLKQPNMAILTTTNQKYRANTCKINEMIKSVSMLIFRIIRDFLKLLFYTLIHIVNLVAL